MSLLFGFVETVIGFAVVANADVQHMPSLTRARLLLNKD